MVPTKKIHMMSQQAPKKSALRFKTIAYLLGTFGQMSKYLSKPRGPKNPQEQERLHEFQALKASAGTTIKSGTKLAMKKARSLTDDHFANEQSEASMLDLERHQSVELEGSSTSDDSQDSVESVLSEKHGDASDQY